MFKVQTEKKQLHEKLNDPEKEKSNQEIDLTFKLKSLQQSLEQEEAEHKGTKAKLADKNNFSQTIEEAKSEALKGQFISASPPLESLGSKTALN